MIPYGRHEITQSDIDAVTQVLQSDFLTQGSAVPKFEKLVAKYCDAKFGIATNSATSALHIACLSLGLKKGDYLWTSPISFVASANCGLYCGAKVDFVDIDPLTFNLSPDALEKKLINAEIANKLPKILIPVHFGGQSCEMDRISKVCKKFGVKIIEDASHAIGGKYKNNPIGNCKYSDVTIFSFHPVKIITTGEGGMSVTNNKKLAERMLLLRSHGVTRDTNLMNQEPDGDWYYQQIELGFNYRMNDIQAALGASQMARLDGYILKRRNIAKKYNEELNNFPIKSQLQHADANSSFHLYVIRVKASEHKNIFIRLRDNSINVNLHYIPIYRQPFFQGFGYNFNDYPNAEKYYSEAITLPIYPTLNSNDHDEIINTMKSLVTK